MTLFQTIAVLGMAVVTFAVRALPFLGVIPRPALKRLAEKQHIFPIMFLALLVVYCLAPAQGSHLNENLMLLGCAALVGALHWYKGNLILSLGVGTAVYLFLVN